MGSIKNIPYRNLPNQSELFLQYLEQTPDALHFFQHPPALQKLSIGFRDKILQQRIPRAEVVSILRRQNKNFDCGPETLSRIDELESPDCVAILTGQQVGLFAGPLYTVYKALTAIRLCEELKRKGIRAVPIFWMETEDHDLAEATRQTVLSQTGQAQPVDFRSALFGKIPASIQPVGSIRFPKGIGKVVEDFTDTFVETEWSDKVRQVLESTYRPGFTFAQSFARLLLKLLEDTGLILFDPQDPQIKSLTAHIFQWALEKSGDIHSHVAERNRELKAAGFHSQVHISEGATILFHIENGERRALEKRDSGFGLKNSSREFTFEELQSCLGSSPEKFSPNVLLRPIIQDTLFATLAYVGGPAEVAYFAQIEALYAMLDKPMPVIWPRESFTLLGNGDQKAMQSLGVEIQDCFDGMDTLKEKWLEKSGRSKTGSGILELEANLGKTFSEIRRDLEALDPSLVKAMDTAESKILHNVHRLKSRILRIEERRDNSVDHAAGLILNHCLPNQNLQERELSIHHFLSSHGPAVLDEIFSGISTSEFFHHVLQLE